MGGREGGREGKNGRDQGGRREGGRVEGGIRGIEETVPL